MLKKILLPLGIALLFACSEKGTEPDAETQYMYCILNDGQCLAGPFSIHDCHTVINGNPSNVCLAESSSSSVTESKDPLSSSSVKTSSSSQENSSSSSSSEISDSSSSGSDSSSSSEIKSSSSSQEKSSSSSSSEISGSSSSGSDSSSSSEIKSSSSSQEKSSSSSSSEISGSSSSGQDSSSSSEIKSLSSSQEKSSSSAAKSSSSAAPESSSSSATPEISSSSQTLQECGGMQWNPDTHFCDARDDKLYRWVKIGTQTWMAENLNYDPKTGNSWCHSDQESNCDISGRLYDWATAMEFCPKGWHLPSNKEWATLMDFVGSADIAGTKLKSKTGWDRYYRDGIYFDGNGTNDYGFNALPGGYRYYYDGGFRGAGNFGLWWSATELTDDFSDFAYFRGVYSNNAHVTESSYTKSYGISVRCVKDN